jgi:hypothetical protein
MPTQVQQFPGVGEQDMPTEVAQSLKASSIDCPRARALVTFSDFFMCCNTAEAFVTKFRSLMERAWLRVACLLAWSRLPLQKRSDRSSTFQVLIIT